MARPRKEFDQEQFEKLCALQCTETEIANWFDMCRDTLIARIQEAYGEGFSTVYKKFSDEGKMSLRRFQFKLAEHNVAMAIFLGKQYLGQKDIMVDQSLHKHFEVVHFNGNGKNTSSRVSGIDTPVAAGSS